VVEGEPVPEEHFDACAAVNGIVFLAVAGRAIIKIPAVLGKAF
jgi:hypothetical protein